MCTKPHVVFCTLGFEVGIWQGHEWQWRKRSRMRACLVHMCVPRSECFELQMRAPIWIVRLQGHRIFAHGQGDIIFGILVLRNSSFEVNFRYHLRYHGFILGRQHPNAQQSCQLINPAGLRTNPNAVFKLNNQAFWQRKKSVSGKWHNCSAALQFQYACA